MLLGWTKIFSYVDFVPYSKKISDVFLFHFNKNLNDFSVNPTHALLC